MGGVQPTVGYDKVVDAAGKRVASSSHSSHPSHPSHPSHSSHSSSSSSSSSASASASSSFVIATLSNESNIPIVLATPIPVVPSKQENAATQVVHHARPIGDHMWCPKTACADVLAFSLAFNPLDLLTEQLYYALPCACKQQQQQDYMAQHAHVLNSTTITATAVTTKTTMAPSVTSAILPTAPTFDHICETQPVTAVNSSLSRDETAQTKETKVPKVTLSSFSCPLSSQSQSPSSSSSVSASSQLYFENHVAGILRLSLTKDLVLCLSLYVPYDSCPVHVSMKTHKVSWRDRNYRNSVKTKFGTHEPSRFRRDAQWLTLIHDGKSKSFEEFSDYAAMWFDTHLQQQMIDVAVTTQSGQARVNAWLKFEDLCARLKAPLHKWPIQYPPLAPLTADFVLQCTQTDWKSIIANEDSTNLHNYPAAVL